MKKEVISLPRNKYPEETRKLILDVAKKLFLEKGYDGTTIKDIIDGLGGLTKGVIYHHFKSKDDIFEQVLEEIADKSENEFFGQLDQSGMTGLEKLQTYLIHSLKSYELISILYKAKIIQKSTRLIGEQYLESMSSVVVEIRSMMQVGIEDGSIVIDFPDEAAEVVIILFNMWFAIQFPNWSREELKRRFMVIKGICDSWDVPIVTDQTTKVVDDLCDYLDTLDEKAIAD